MNKDNENSDLGCIANLLFLVYCAICAVFVFIFISDNWELNKGIIVIIAFVGAGFVVWVPLFPGIIFYNRLVENGYPGLGMFVLIISIILQVVMPLFLLFTIGGSLSEINSLGGVNRQPSGTKTIYDKKGNVKGYIDKEDH